MGRWGGLENERGKTERRTSDNSQPSEVGFWFETCGRETLGDGLPIENQHRLGERSQTRKERTERNGRRRRGTDAAAELSGTCSPGEREEKAGWNNRRAKIGKESMVVEELAERGEETGWSEREDGRKGDQ
jgi:hypothetical protein